MEGTHVLVGGEPFMRVAVASLRGPVRVAIPTAIGDGGASPLWVRKEMERIERAGGEQARAMCKAACSRPEGMSV